MIRLQKLIANRGYCSRRKAEKLIVAGSVKVNNEVINTLGQQVPEDAIIEIDGKVLIDDEKKYFLLNKPRGVLATTNDPKKRKTVIDLIDCQARLYPVGRLDYDTTGLIILTNDGNLANLIMHPRHQIEKKYIVKIKTKLLKADIDKLTKGVKIDNVISAPSRIQKVRYDVNSDTTIFTLIIREGRNHQVKKMLKAIGKDVIKLKREAIGFLNTQGLKSGEYRPLTAKEVKKLYALKNNTN